LVELGSLGGALVDTTRDPGKRTPKDREL